MNPYTRELSKTFLENVNENYQGMIKQMHNLNSNSGAATSHYLTAKVSGKKEVDIIASMPQEIINAEIFIMRLSPVDKQLIKEWHEAVHRGAEACKYFGWADRTYFSTINSILVSNAALCGTMHLIAECHKLTLQQFLHKECRLGHWIRYIFQFKENDYLEKIHPEDEDEDFDNPY